MVKAEYDQDHYAALELSSTASANEIKKQFKKLGMSHRRSWYRPLLTRFLQKHCNSTRTEIPMKIPLPSFNQSRRRMRSLRIPSRGPSTMLTACEQAC